MKNKYSYKIKNVYISCMKPTVIVDSLFCFFFVFEVTLESTRSFGTYLWVKMSNVIAKKQKAI